MLLCISIFHSFSLFSSSFSLFLKRVHIEGFLRKVLRPVLDQGAVLHLASGILPFNSHIRLLLWHLHVHVESAGAHKTVVPLVVPTITILPGVWCCSLGGSSDIIMKILTEVLWRSLWEDVVNILMYSFYWILFIGQVLCMILYRSLWEDLVKIWLTSSTVRGALAWSCTGPYKKILWRLSWNSSLRGPCMILYRSLSEDLVEILVTCSMILYRSLWDLVQVLVWRSLH